MWCDKMGESINFINSFELKCKEFKGTIGAATLSKLKQKKI